VQRGAVESHEGGTELKGGQAKKPARLPSDSKPLSKRHRKASAGNPSWTHRRRQTTSSHLLRLFLRPSFVLRTSVPDDDGERIRGVFIPEEERCGVPLIVEQASPGRG
jgi:hypothetical protein